MNSNIQDDKVYFIYFDSDERTWICTDKGICFWDKHKSDFYMDNFPEIFIHKNQIHYITEDRKGNFLFCYDARNVMFSDPEIKNFRQVCKEEDAGFTGLRILKVLQEESGTFWFIGSRGGMRANESLTYFELFSIPYILR